MAADTPPLPPQDRKICFCHNVLESQIVMAISEGAVTIEEIRKRTKANTGCGGCEFEVRDILKKHAR